ncbi:hypothetical protein, partial [Helicobacter sp. T3_23-1059]
LKKMAKTLKNSHPPPNPLRKGRGDKKNPSRAKGGGFRLPRLASKAFNDKTLHKNLHKKTRTQIKNPKNLNP